MTPDPIRQAAREERDRKIAEDAMQAEREKWEAHTATLMEEIAERDALLKEMAAALEPLACFNRNPLTYEVNAGVRVLRKYWNMKLPGATTCRSAAAEAQVPSDAGQVSGAPGGATETTGPGATIAGPPSKPGDRQTAESEGRSGGAPGPSFEVTTAGCGCPPKMESGAAGAGGGKDRNSLPAGASPASEPHSRSPEQWARTMMDAETTLTAAMAQARREGEAAMLRRCVEWVTEWWSRPLAAKLRSAMEETP